MTCVSWEKLKTVTAAFGRPALQKAVRGRWTGRKQVLLPSCSYFRHLQASQLGEADQQAAVLPSFPPRSCHGGFTPPARPTWLQTHLLVIGQLPICLKDLFGEMQIFRKYRGIIPPGVLKTHGHLEICEVHRADKFVRPMCSKKNPVLSHNF